MSGCIVQESGLVGCRGEGYLVLCLGCQQIQAPNCQPELSTVCHLPDAGTQVHQLIAGNLNQIERPLRVLLAFERLLSWNPLPLLLSNCYVSVAADSKGGPISSDKDWCRSGSEVYDQSF